MHFSQKSMTITENDYLLICPYIIIEKE